MRGGKISTTLNSDDIHFDYGLFKEKNVIAVYVDKAESKDIPVHLNGDITLAYIRLNTGDHRISQSELRNILSSHTKLNADAGILKNSGLNEINTKTLQKYRQYIRLNNPTSHLLALEDLDLLKRINVCRASNVWSNAHHSPISSALLLGLSRDSR